MVWIGPDIPAGGKPPVTGVEVQEVTKRFGRTVALDQVSFTVGQGETRALLGHNGAGKSTLVSLLAGVNRPDAGRVLVAGEEITGPSSRIGCVFQRSSLVPALSAAENVFRERYPRRRGAVDWGEMRRQARVLLGDWEIAEVVDRPVEELAPIQCKVIEICRALALQPGLLLLDEPTAGLDRKDAEHLFQLLKRLRGQTTIIYISHHLQDIRRVCDSVTVLRDARHVLTRRLEALTDAEMVAAIVGEQQPQKSTGRRCVPVAAGAPVVMSARRICSGTRVGPVDVEVRAGECVGITGLQDSGKELFAQALVGLAPRSGQLRVGRKVVPAGDAARALDAGMGFVPQDRHRDGLVPGLDVCENATMTAAPRQARRLWGLGPRISHRGVLDALYERLSRQWRIVASSSHQRAAELSGGNQQKVVMARALATEPDLLVLVNPTAGVDVGARESITESLAALLDGGTGVVVVSEDAGDFTLCHRILVMGRGRIRAHLAGNASEADLVSAMQTAEVPR